MAVKAANQAVAPPSLGLFLATPAWQIPPSGLMAGNNVRIYLGRVTSYNMGWTLFMATALNGPVTLIDVFQLSTGASVLIFGTPKDLYNYNAGTPIFLTPITNDHTVAINHGSPTLTGTSTTWQSQAYPVKAGDQVYVGANNQVSPSATWYTVKTVDSDTQITLTANYAGTTVSGAAYTIRQLFTGDAQTHHWNSETFPGAGAPDNSDLWMATNGSDFPIKWNGQTAQVTYLASFPFKAYELRRFKNMMIYGGLIMASGSYKPADIANSDNGLPTSMNTGIAGQYTVTDGPFFINHLGVLGNSLMIYTNRSVISSLFVGQPTNFVFTEVVRGKGPIGSRLVAEFPDRHQFIGQDGQYRYNGLFIQIMNPHVWRAIIASFDASRADRAFIAINEQFGDLHWVLPLTSDPAPPAMATAYTEHYLEQAQNPLFKPFTQRDFPFTVAGSYTQSNALTWNLLTNPWNTYQIAWNSSALAQGASLTLVGDANGYVYTLYSADTQNSVGYKSTATFPPRFTINERSRGLVKRVYPAADAIGSGSYPLSVTLTMYDQTGGVPTIVDVQTMPLDYSVNRFTTHYRRGRLGSIGFSTPGPNQPWSVGGYDWDVVPGGQR